MNLPSGPKGVPLHLLSKFVDLKDTPAEFLVCTPDKKEVKERIKSE